MPSAELPALPAGRGSRRCLCPPCGGQSPEGGGCRRQGGRAAGWLAGWRTPSCRDRGRGWGGGGGAWVCVCLSVRVVATAKRSGAVWGAGSLGAKLCNVVGRHSKSINPPPPRSYQQPPCQPQRTKTETKTPAAPRAVMFPRHQSAWGDSTLPSTGASLWGNSVKSWPSFRVRCRRGGWMCEQNLMVYTWKLQAACQLGKEEQVLSTAMPS